MAPRRPPPLPASLFTGQGPLAPGSAKLAPSPSTLHPQRIVDASLPGSIPTIQVTFSVEESPAPPTTNVTDVLIDPRQTSMQSEKEWNALEAQLDEMSGNPGLISEMKASTLQGSIPGEGDVSAEPIHRIVLSGLLPPALDASISPSQLIQSLTHNALWTPHIASLSLKENVYLKVLPPIVHSQADAGDAMKWWESREQIKECLKIYLAHALECFGAHRLMFGTTPTSNTSELLESYIQPISTTDWFPILREVLAELVANETSGSPGRNGSPAQQYMDDVFGKVAMAVYDGLDGVSNT